MRQIDIRKYTWLIYPVVVVLGILASSVFLLAPSFWQNLFSTAAAVQQATTTANNLQTKLRTLAAVNVPTETDNLTYLLSILPSSKQIPILISQLQSAAADTGTVLESYRFDAGDISATQSAKPVGDDLILSVTYIVSDISTLKNLLANLAGRTPLLAVHEVHFLTGKVDLKIDALWSPLAKLAAAGPNEPLPNAGNDVLRIKQQFAANAAVVNNASGSGNQTVSTNPF